LIGWNICPASGVYTPLRSTTSSVTTDENTQNLPSKFSGTTAVPGTMRPATIGTIDASGFSAPHG
jgi:hypothetical protein